MHRPFLARTDGLIKYPDLGGNSFSMSSVDAQEAEVVGVYAL